MENIVLADTHCHLDFHVFDEDRDQVVERAREAGVRWIVDPGIDIESSRAAVKLAEKYPEVYAAVGIHPNSAQSWDRDSLNNLTELTTHPKVVAIGEIGLDYYRDHAPHELQKEVFLQQLELAADKGLPVIIHNRQATADVLDAIAGWCSRLKQNHRLNGSAGVLHSYSGDNQTAQRVKEWDFYIGINGPVTFTNARSLQQTVASIEMEQILIETDAPFLTPHPLRGKRNEPALVRKVCEKIASLHGITLEAAAKLTTANAKRLFRWS